MYICKIVLLILYVFFKKSNNALLLIKIECFLITACEK